MMAMGAIMDSKSSNFTIHHIKQLARARGGETLVKILEFEIAYKASEGVYAEAVFEWNAELIKDAERRPSNGEFEGDQDEVEELRERQPYYRSMLGY